MAAGCTALTGPLLEYQFDTTGFTLQPYTTQQVTSSRLLSMKITLSPIFKELNKSFPLKISLFYRY